MIVAVSNLLDGKGEQRKAAHEAARILTGYLLGLPIEATATTGKTTEVRDWTVQGVFWCDGYSPSSSGWSGREWAKPSIATRAHSDRSTPQVKFYDFFGGNFNTLSQMPAAKKYTPEDILGFSILAITGR